jgi:hypothetical protein
MTLTILSGPPILEHHRTNRQVFTTTFGLTRCGNTIPNSPRIMPGRISGLSSNPLDFNA